MKKKFLSVILTLCLLLPVIALAEIDLSEMSVDELIALNKAVVMELMSRKDFKEVAVPAGEYKVGEDIPAGTYTVKAEGDQYIALNVLDKNGNYTLKMYSVEEDNPIGKLALEDGETVATMGGIVIFTPYAGLGF
nr:MAG TPA: hypothetical protein [Caudoviricetes sp.]